MLFAAEARADSLDRTLDRMIEVYGGESSLRKADRQQQEWDFFALGSEQHGVDRRSMFLPGRLKVELDYPQRQETRLLNENASTVILGDNTARLATVPQRDAMRLQLMRLYSPLALRDRIEQLDLARHEGRIVLTLRELGLRTDYFVDAESWRIETVVGYLSVGGRKMTFLTEYSDFDHVDDVLIHRRENKFVGNVNTAVLRLRTIEFDVDFGDNEFTIELGPVKEQADATIAKN